jgi:hypothetical protein
LSFLAFLNRMNPNIPLALPPPLGLPLPPPGIPPLPARVGPPVNNRPYLLGSEISYEDLVPGQEYYRRVMFGLGPHYERIQLVSKTNDTYQYRDINDRNVYPFNRQGNPLPPYTIPSAPLPPGVPPRNTLSTDPYIPDRMRFFKISNVKKGRHLIGSRLRRKVNRNTRRQAINRELERYGLSTNTGTGPANLIRSFVGLQPPKGAKGGKRTRRQRRA